MMAEQPGMMPRDQWEQTEVHKASQYWCAKCGESFKSPRDFYEHLDAMEGKPHGKKRRKQ